MQVSYLSLSTASNCFIVAVDNGHNYEETK